MIDLKTELQGNSYPGRGIVLGRSKDGKHAVIGYFIMGRSVNSRNRVFLEEPDGIRTEAYDPAKMVDPSLVIYHPVREWKGSGGTTTIVTNGDQTDTLRDYLSNGKDYLAALNSRTFEPDGPNWTPRISGLVYPDGTYMLSILKSADGDASCCNRNFFTYDAPLKGVGHFIHTYAHDGDPIPSFEGEPKRVALDYACINCFTKALWENLNPENKVSLFTRFINLETGETRTRIVNKNGGE